MSLWVNYNLKEYELEKLSIPVTDRAFQYGDGVFETMIYTHGRIQFLKDHLERLEDGMRALGLKISKSMAEIDLQKVIKNLCEKSKIDGDARVKVQVWRKEGGLYTPETNKANFLIQVKEFEKRVMPPMRTSVVTGIHNQLSPFSRYKTLSSLRYVVGGIQKREKKVDDVVFFSEEGFVSEFLSSNIFWIKDKIIYTPKLQTGCVSGIARKNIIDYLKFNGHSVRKVMARKTELLEADVILSTNVTGVRLVESIDDEIFKIQDAWRVLFENAY